LRHSALILEQHNVAGLQISMDYILPVNGGHSFANLVQNLENQVYRKRSFFSYNLFEGTPLQKFHDHKWHSRIEQSEIEHSHNVLVRNIACDACFSLEAKQVILLETGKENGLEGNRSFHHLVVSFIDRPHTPGTKFVPDQ